MSYTFNEKREAGMWQFYCL